MNENVRKSLVAALSTQGKNNGRLLMAIAIYSPNQFARMIALAETHKDVRDRDNCPSAIC